MKLGYSTCNYPHRNLEEHLVFAKQQGFDFLEVIGMHMSALLEENPQKTVRQIKESGLEITVHHALPEPTDHEAVERFRQSVKVLYEWGKDGSIFSVLSFDTWVDRMKSLPVLLWVLELFRDTDIQIATEDFPLNKDELEQWKQITLYPNFALLTDLGHMNVRLCDKGDQPIWCLENEGEGQPSPRGDNSIEAFGNALKAKPLKIIECHLHSNDGQRDAHEMLDGGNFPTAEICKLLQDYGFDGYIDLEGAPTLHGMYGEEADAALLRDRDLWLALWNKRDGNDLRKGGV